MHQIVDHVDLVTLNALFSQLKDIYPEVPESFPPLRLEEKYLRLTLDMLGGMPYIIDYNVHESFGIFEVSLRSITLGKRINPSVENLPYRSIQWKLVDDVSTVEVSISEDAFPLTQIELDDNSTNGLKTPCCHREFWFESDLFGGLNLTQRWIERTVDRVNPDGITSRANIKVSTNVDGDNAAIHTIELTYTPDITESGNTTSIFLEEDDAQTKGEIPKEWMYLLQPGASIPFIRIMLDKWNLSTGWWGEKEE